MKREKLACSDMSEQGAGTQHENYNHCLNMIFSRVKQTDVQRVSSNNSNASTITLILSNIQNKWNLLTMYYNATPFLSYKQVLRRFTAIS